MSIKQLNIQNHRTLAQRYRNMARAAQGQQRGSRSEVDNATYAQLIEMAEDHERAYRVLGKKRGQTFIFVRR